MPFSPATGAWEAACTPLTVNTRAVAIKVRLKGWYFILGYSGY
jgi:hypothetical protein